ncbi:MAG: Abi family protein [Acidimicrobiales bacterium]
MSFNPAIESAVSTPRFDRFRAAASDDGHAWELYRWNIELTSSFAPLAADLEVALRNTIHQQLTDLCGSETWWTSSSLLLDDITAEMLTDVVQKYRRKLDKGSVGAGKVISELSLGTWVRLLSKGGHSALGRSIDYDRRLWRPALRRGFATGELNRNGEPRRPTRKDVHARAETFQRLRNRCAHHEPIIDGIQAPGTTTMLPLGQVWHDCVELLRWISPPLAEIHKEQPPFLAILAQRP